MKSSRRTRKNISKPESRIIKTSSGEIFADGTIIELVASAPDRPLDLLLWTENGATIAPQIEHLGHVYQAPDLDDSLRRAIRFPDAPTNYGAVPKFLSQTLTLFEHYMGLARPEAGLMTAWTSSTWFPDCVSSPPTLVISGQDMSHAVNLFRLLSCLCRRPLVIAGMSQAAFHSIMSWQPTLLVNQPGLSPKIWQLWDASNFRGVHTFGSGGRLLEVVGSKAFFGGTADTGSDEAMHLALPAVHSDLPALDEQQQTEIANRYQPHFLSYRLRNFRRVVESRSSGRQRKFPNSATARNLAACMQEDDDDDDVVAQAVAPLLRCQEELALARRGCDVTVALVEVMWTSLHHAEEITISQITILTNTLLRCRGETLEYSAEEIGWKLKHLGLDRRRNGSGMALRFSRDNSLRVHQLARHFGLTLPKADGCPDCAEAEVVVEQ